MQKGAQAGGAAPLTGLIRRPAGAVWRFAKQIEEILRNFGTLFLTKYASAFTRSIEEKTVCNELFVGPGTLAQSSHRTCGECFSAEWRSDKGLEDGKQSTFG